MDNNQKDILKKCVIKALEVLDKNSWDPKNNSRTGDLVYKGKLYPTKPILWEIEKQIKSDNLGIEIPTLSGGEAIFKYFEKLGFEIKRKRLDTFKNLIDKYVDILHTKGEPNEKYKYIAIDTFQNNWDIESDEFLEMFKKSFSKVSNLLYQNSWGFIIKAAEYFPDETRQMFKDLYNNEIELSIRIKNFQISSESILEKQKGLLKRDNLSAQQDERTISVYLAFRYPEKYILYKSDYYQNYCEEANTTSQKTGERFIHLNLIADNWIKHNYLDDEALELIYRKFYPKPSWDDNRLMVQNILYVCYREEKSGANLINTLNKFDYDDLLNYYSFLDNIINHFNLKESDKKLVFNFNERQLKFTIGQRYIWNIRAINSKDYTFRAISTNQFSMSHELFDGLPKAFLNNESNFNLITSNSNNIYQAIENELKRTKKSGYSKHNDNSIEQLAFDGDYREHIFSQLDRNKNINTEFQLHSKKDMINIPLNQILYGPPGTGKTYNSINKAISIINPNFDLSQDRETVKKEFDRLVVEGQIVFTTFHQSMAYEDFIEGIKPTMKGDGDEDGELYYEIQDGIFKLLCNNALSEEPSVIVNNFEEAWEKLIARVRLNISQEKLLKIGSWEYSLSSKNSLKYSSLNSPSQYTFTITKQNIYDAYQSKKARPSGAFQKDMLDIVEFMKKELQLNEYNKIKTLNKENNQVNQNYVIIIDEINRGNVSQIFGELITLIEDSKRLGEVEALEVTLSYSKKKFGVPSNVYIIGTMNTADRSVEALDTALRRRFSFVEMMPDENVFETLTFSDTYARKEIMQKINQRVEVLLDRNYTLGHSYFIKEDFKNSFENEIMPLLQEYFYNDYGKIGLVLGKGFVREKAITAKNDKSIFADFDTKNEVDIIKSYELIPFNDVDFDTALKTLLALHA